MSERQEAVDQRRYVVGVDGSAESLEALRWAVTEARAHQGGDVRAVLVWTVPYQGLATSMTPEPYGLPEVTTLEEQARSRLASAIDGVGDTSPVVVHPEVREGQAAGVLLELSREADLVVVGSRGHGGFTSLLLGSVSAQVVRHAHCSVVVVRPPS
ncbi:MAG TPA: universal stress protein [Dermatophilaceae bacterium]